jgi:CheY-like chemotaxis protein
VAVVTEGGPKQTVNTAKIDLNQFPPLTGLVVDNTQSNQDLIAGYFSHTHHHLLFAQDGLRGMQVAQAHRADLIFLDLLMPVMGGHETAIALKQDPTTRHIPIILITASLSYAGKTITPNSPYAGILHKPVNRQQIADGELWGGLLVTPSPSAAPWQAQEVDMLSHIVRVSARKPSRNCVTLRDLRQGR